ncbi:MAG: glycosyltransferase [Pseudomonadota bacterium]|nr:glycosyltransferase [Pseudomonadota bacterium]
MIPVRILFVTWDGPQVAYLESLYLPIFEALMRRGHSVHVLQFTWADAAQRAAIQVRCEAAGCTYRSVSVLRTPVAAGGLITAVLGRWHVMGEIKRHAIDVVMPRSTLPALAAGLALKQATHVRMVFDADGLPHDERVDFEGWSPHGLAYRVLRDMEASAVRRADVVLTRSRKAIDILAARAGGGTAEEKFLVVGNGRDAERFRPASDAERAATRRELGVSDAAPFVVYAGSIGEQYCLAEMLSFFRRVRALASDASLLLLTGSPEAAERGLDGFDDLRPHCQIRHVAADDVARFLGAADLGLALRRPTFSMQAVAPIKLGEYLLCGIPVLATQGIGDTDALLTPDVGRSLAAMTPDTLDAAADWFVRDVLQDREGFRARSRKAGLQNFNLAATVEAYANAIARVASR